MAAAKADVRLGVRYLEVEVPKWKRDNGCRSCHNDGDGLRALIAAARVVKVDAAVLAESLGALDDLAGWEAKPLSRLQFAAAAREAVAAGLVKRVVLERAAAAVAADQDAGDGHWKVEEELAVGSPVTYGPVLATWMAREVLRSADAAGYAGSIARATRWIQARPVAGAAVVDLAAIVLAVGRAGDREKLAAAQLANGSWNNEPFDTAVAMLAVGKTNAAAVLARARGWLAARQLPGGGWPGTTRPAGGESYAQHISTTAWVVMALAASATEGGSEAPRKLHTLAPQIR